MIFSRVTTAARCRGVSGRLGLFSAVIAAGVWACWVEGGDLDVGNTAPRFAVGSGGNTLTLIARAEDCISCGFRDTFVAMRALENATSSTGAKLDVALWIVTSNPKDTVVVRQLLTRQRLVTRIGIIRPTAARAVFKHGKIPAVYLIQDGVVVREWEAGTGGVLVVGRDDFAEALR